MTRKKTRTTSFIRPASNPQSFALDRDTLLLSSAVTHIPTDQYYAERIVQLCESVLTADTGTV